MATKETLGSMIHRVIKEKHLSFRGAAKELGVSNQATVHGWVYGKGHPSQQHIPKLAAFLEKKEEDVVAMVCAETGLQPRASSSCSLENKDKASAAKTPQITIDANDLDRVRSVVAAYGTPIPLELFVMIVVSKRGKLSS